MSKAIVIKMFLKKGTATLPKGIYDVTLRNITSYRWRNSSIKNGTLGNATHGQVVNCNRNKVSLPLSRFTPIVKKL